MKKIHSLEEAFVHGLSDIYSAEKQLVKALPKLGSSKKRSANRASLCRRLRHWFPPNGAVPAC